MNSLFFSSVISDNWITQIRELKFAILFSVETKTIGYCIAERNTNDHIEWNTYAA